ncbi:hypothetical protein CCH79_00019442, partial [Gambusia affinis]
RQPHLSVSAESDPGSVSGSGSPIASGPLTAAVRAAPLCPLSGPDGAARCGREGWPARRPADIQPEPGGGSGVCYLLGGVGTDAGCCVRSHQRNQDAEVLDAFRRRPGRGKTTVCFLQPSSLSTDPHLDSAPAIFPQHDAATILGSIVASTFLPLVAEGGTASFILAALPVELWISAAPPELLWLKPSCSSPHFSDWCECFSLLMSSNAADLLMLVPCSQGEGSDSAHFPAKAFWICLSALLLLVAMAIGLTGYLALTGPGSTSLQTVRLTAPDQTGVLLNQTAVLDSQNHLVTLSVTAAGNQTSTVLFDVKHVESAIRSGRIRFQQ